jgi:hypothetical protein
VRASLSREFQIGHNQGGIGVVHAINLLAQLAAPTQLDYRSTVTDIGRTSIKQPSMDNNRFYGEVYYNTSASALPSPSVESDNVSTDSSDPILLRLWRVAERNVKVFLSRFCGLRGRDGIIMNNAHVYGLCIA